VGLGGGTYLGDPIDDDGNLNPGECWDYCFSSTNNTWGDYPTEFGLGNTVPAPVFGNNGPSMNPNGVYLPEGDFSNFIGCPVDGDWSILVTDHLVSDNGFICGWGIEVSALLLLGLSDNVSQDVGQNTIEVYPNPATQMLNLHSKSGEISRIDLYDIRGKILLSFEGAGVDQQLDISDLDNGVYILSVKTKEGYSSVRVVKE
jgi:Secretion system C-terminal sorting domain